MKYLVFGFILFISFLSFSQHDIIDNSCFFDSIANINRCSLERSNVIGIDKIFSKFDYNIYLDSSLKMIDSPTYKAKCINRMKKGFEFLKNDTLISIVYNKFQFGVLSDYSNNRIRREIYRNNTFKGIIIIHYSYTIISTDEEYKRSLARDKHTSKIKIIGLENTNFSLKKKFKIKNKIQRLEQRRAKIITKEGVLKKRKRSYLEVNKCIKKLKNKYVVDVLHYYLDGTPDYSPKLNWIKDKNQIIKNYFFKYLNQYSMVIIKPDGQYLQIGGLITPKKIKKLLKHKDWSEYIEDLKKSEIARKGVGFFNMEHIHNCL